MTLPARPWVIAHRGASGERPEHSIAAYRLAIEQGADFIEPDVVISRDGVLVARHENELSDTTDVAERAEFADRHTTKRIDGRSVTGWFAEDFTLAELKCLRLRERLPELRPGSAAYDRESGIVTLSELAALVNERSMEMGRPIGLVVELKHAAYFDTMGLPLDRALLAELNGELGRLAERLFVESFEVGVLERLRGAGGLRLVQALEAQGGPADRPNLTYADMASPAGLAAIARYADAIAPAKAWVVPRDEGARSLPPTHLVADAEAAGLMTFAWTFRSENLFLPAELRRGDDLRAHGDAATEMEQFFSLGVDAVFSDFPATAVAARRNRHPGESRNLRR